MGLALGVGTGRIDIEAVKDLLQNPKLPETNRPPNNKCSHMLAPSKGLTLTDVIYSDEQMKHATDDVMGLPIGNPTGYPSPRIQWSVSNILLCKASVKLSEICPFSSNLRSKFH